MQTLWVNNSRILRIKNVKFLGYYFYMNLEHIGRFANLHQCTFKCKGRLKKAPIPIEAKLPILIYREHYLSKLIIWDIHRKLKHAGTKQTLTELRQRYWISQSRNYVRNIIRRCRTCRKLHCKHYNHPKTPSLTKFQLADTQPFSTTGVDNFGPLYVRNMFNRNDCEMRKVWITIVHMYLHEKYNIGCFSEFIS